MRQVYVPSQLRGYTDGADVVDAEGDTLDAVLHALDARFPGLRFRVIDEQRRVRRHIVLFEGEHRQDDLDAPLRPGVPVHILGALSGG